MATLRTASRNYGLSVLIAQRAAREAQKVRARGSNAVAGVVITHQVANAKTSNQAVAEMLAEQDIRSVPAARLNLASFTTDPATVEQMVGQVATDWAFAQMVSSIVQDAGRAVESVAVAVRPGVSHTRLLSPPSCSRCAVLAGRVYRWSTGFQRHPGCDCTMIPTTAGSPYAQDVEQLVRSGQVTGLSKADRQALNEGADLGQVVNVHRKGAGLLEGGHALTRGGRPTPAGIYRVASDRTQALDLLKRYGYIL